MVTNGGGGDGHLDGGERKGPIQRIAGPGTNAWAADGDQERARVRGGRERGRVGEEGASRGHSGGLFRVVSPSGIGDGGDASQGPATGHSAVNVLLDTHVVSEWVKPRPDEGVIAWVDGLDEDRAFLSVITLAELQFGTARLPDGSRKTRLATWVEDQLPLRFEGRILSVDVNTARLWGVFAARRDASGRSLGAMDGLIAATAAHHNLTLVTRNVSDFTGLDVELLNPWRA